MSINTLKQDITDKVIALMEEHGSDWTKPWLVNSGLPINVETKNQYHGINIMVLAMQEMPTNEWGTYRQWLLKDAQVKKGEKGTHIIFYKNIKNLDDDGKFTNRGFMSHSTVFNSSQVEGYDVETPEPKGLGEKMDDVEEFIGNSGANIIDGAMAYYSPSDDKIRIPDVEYFFGTSTSSEIECYYSTLLHELTHWTGASHRLDRDLKNKNGSKDYAKEELVAELGATFLGIQLGIHNEPRVDHAQYLNAWMKVLKDDTTAIFKASTMASKAVDYLNELNSYGADEEVSDDNL